MCIFFESKEKAEEAYQMMKEVYYGPLHLIRTQTQTQTQKQKQPQISTSQVLFLFLLTFSPALLLAFVMLLFSFAPVATASPLFLAS